MNTRRANIEDVGQIRHLFYNTIITVNSKDYNENQISVWSSGYENIDGWLKKIEEQFFFVAERNKNIVGFASLTREGCIDLMYVHKDFQQKGIATALLKTIEQLAIEFHLKKIWADVSITAKPFFAKRGFLVTEVYTKTIKEVNFQNSIMTKTLM